MLLPENTQMTDAKIADVTVQVPQPFVEGHSLTESEAKVLNQVLKENLSNNLRSKITKFVKELGDDIEAIATAAQEALNTYLGTYEFGVRAVSSARLTPLERRMKKLAGVMVRALIKKSEQETGNKVSVENRDELIGKVLENETYREKLETQAKAELEVEQKAAEDVGMLDLNDLVA